MFLIISTSTNKKSIANIIIKKYDNYKNDYDKLVENFNSLSS